jgi:ABC-type bacteriocin/lantibiotic exporter with double-glycine peptidase domain
MFPSKRVPVVLQMSAADCGAACLAMIGGYWGGRLSLAACQRLMGGSASGVTALMITQAARPKILILDEATSHLDAAEAAIQQTLDRLQATSK